MSPGIKSDTSKRLGALLLRGWAMLAENCPDCQVPLMKERTTEERLCVNCDTTFIPDRQGLRPTNRTPNDQPDMNLQQQQQDQDEARNRDGPGPADGLEEASYVNDPRADPRLGPFASQSTERQENATLSHRHGTTTSTKEAGSLSINNGFEIATEDLSSGHAGVVAAASAAPLGDSGLRDIGGSVANDIQLAAGARGARSSATASTDGSEDVADLLAAKMLQGWALLDKYCPRCNTVLVRSKANKRMFCVACAAWVVPEADTPPPPHQQQQGRVKEDEEKEKEHQPILSRQAACAAAVKARPGPVAGPHQPSPALSSHQESPQQLPSVLLPDLPRYRQQQRRQQFLQVDEAPLLQPQAADERGPAVLGSEVATLPEFSQSMPGFVNSCSKPTFSLDVPQQHQQKQPQLSPMYQQFFAPVAPRTTGGGSGSCSRGSSPPQTWLGGSPSFSHEALLSALRVPVQHQQQQQARSPRHASFFGQQQVPPQTQGGGGGGNGAGPRGGGSAKQPSGTALLLSIGRTVALKMAEAQGLLERTPALDTERARSYVALITECLDLLSKLHSLQQ